jgi:large subunit ribosomal protein L25
MKTYKIVAQKREKTGSGQSKKLRKEGFVTGEVYGAHEKNIHIKIPSREFEKFLKETSQEMALIDMEINGKKYKCILKELHRDVVRGEPLHADFQILHAREPIHVVIPLVLKGTPEGIKLGGILEHLKREVNIKAIPSKLPGHIEIDVSGLKIGDSIHIKDLEIPEEVEILEDPDETVCTILSPKKVEEVVPVEEVPAEEVPAEEKKEEEEEK